MMKRVLLFLSALALGPAGAFAAGTCPNVSIPSGRSNIHTEVRNATTGNLMAIYSGRIFRSGTDLFFVINVSTSCPNQGCGINVAPPITQDCTATQTPSNFFAWALSHGNTVLNTKSEGLDIKNPSGTVIMNQSRVNAPHGSTCPIASMGSGSTPAVLTEVVNRATGLGMKVVSVRILQGAHGSGGPIDFYAIISVNPSMTFTLPTSRVSDCTQSGSKWYDTYWTGDTQTVTEDIVQSPEYPGVLQLNQGVQ